MDFLGTVAQVLGDAVNGVLQVIADFINLIIEIVPNPDPFPELIANLNGTTAANMSFGWYWLDAFVGVEFGSMVIGIWGTLMIASSVFAVIYWVVKAIKP